MIEQQQEQLPPAIIIEKKTLDRDELAPGRAGSQRGELDEVSHMVAIDELVYVCSLAPLFSRALTRSTLAAVTMSNNGLDPLTPCVVTMTRESPDVWLYEARAGTLDRRIRGPLLARVRYNARHSRFEPTNPLGRTPSRPTPRQRYKAPTTATQAKKDEQDMADFLIIQEELSNKILGQAAPDGAVKREEAVEEATTTASSTRVPVDQLTAIGRAECSKMPTFAAVPLNSPLVNLPDPRTTKWNGTYCGNRPREEPAKKAKTEHTESMMTEVPEPLKPEANQSLFDELVEYNKELRARDQLHRMAEEMINAPVMQPSPAKTEKCSHTVPPPTWAGKSDCEMTRLTERLADLGFKNRSTEERYEREQARLERRYGDIVVAKEDARRSYEAQLAACEKTIWELKLQNDVIPYTQTRVKNLEAARDELGMQCAMSKLELVGQRELCKAQESELVTLRESDEAQKRKQTRMDRLLVGMAAAKEEARCNHEEQLWKRDTEIAKLNRQLDTVSYTHPRVKQLEASRDELQKQRVLSDLEVVGLRELCRVQESELVTLREADEAQERELALLRERNAFLEQYKQDATELMTRLQQHIMSM
jgi:hypothetical protein